MKRWFRYLAYFFLMAIVLAALGIYFRAPLLCYAARAWIVNDTLTNADAIVVLGGGVDTRPFAAAKLYHRGLAPRILYMSVKVGPADLVVPDDINEQELTRRVLLTNGVPASALEAVGNGVANTHDESLAVRRWVDKNGAKSIIIATDIFHTRRARWVFQHALTGTNAKVQMDAVSMLSCDSTNWWQHEEGLIAFETEIFKYGFYRMKY